MGVSNGRTTLDAQIHRPPQSSRVRGFRVYGLGCQSLSLLWCAMSFASFELEAFLCKKKTKEFSDGQLR